MWRVKLLIPSLAIFSCVHGIILSGSCPRLINPPTVNFRPNDTLALDIILSVPFSSSKGPYLFQQFGMNTVNVFRVTAGIYDSETYFQLEGDFTLDKSYVYSQIISQQDGELTFNSTVSSNFGGDCFPPKTHHMKLWIEGDYMILWSCLDITDPYEYDEGFVLLKILHEPEEELAYKLLNSNSCWIEPMNQELKVITAKYLSANLMAGIKWWDPNGRPTDLIENPFDCRRVERDFEGLFRSLLCYVIFMVLVIFATFEYKCRFTFFRKRDCQVHPYST